MDMDFVCVLELEYGRMVDFSRIMVKWIFFLSLLLEIFLTDILVLEFVWVQYN